MAVIDLVIQDAVQGHEAQLINVTGGGDPVARPGFYVGEIEMRSGDQLPLLTVAIEDDFGIPANLGGATECEFVLTNLDGRDPRVVIPYGQTPKTHMVLPAAIIDAATGVVSFDWGLYTALRPGVLDVVVIVKTPGGNVVAPTDRSARITVRPDPYPIHQGVAMSMTGCYDLAVYRGDTFEWLFRLWADLDRTQPVDLAGATAKAEIRNAPGGLVVVALDCQVSAPNLIGATLDTVGSSRVPAAGVWDLQVTFPDGVVKTPLAGKVYAVADVRLKEGLL